MDFTVLHFTFNCLYATIHKGDIANYIMYVCIYIYMGFNLIRKIIDLAKNGQNGRLWIFITCPVMYKTSEPMGAGNPGISKP